MKTSVDDIWTQYMNTRRPELREELIAHYAPLARFVVGRLGIPPSSLLDTEDLIGYGMIGLINAIDRYDPSRGVRFESFATPRIRGAVIDQIRQLNWLPRSAVSRMRQVEDTLATLEQRLQRPATETEAAEAMGVSIDQYRQMLLDMSATVLSLDAPLGSMAQEDDATSLSDLLEDEQTTGPAEQVEQHELVTVLAEAIERLPEREQLLLSLYYKEELTMKEISRIMNVSESRICQLRMQAIMHLRASMQTYQTGEAKARKTPRKKAEAGQRRGRGRPRRKSTTEEKSTD
ncbi:RNA polymerase sigma factor WhiG [Thermosporothrix hazakensis]|uniref:RNA polymerase sigma factor WhiG n=1 Tax=Thermosporothrix sp. COM3 TaxID=2490863 RepID=A0A455SNH5_9CHLR|nr:RNA polymerase sigma factor WhiG [Thermosporothrix sp. COM3]GCE47392.1 RNA polymerase sigma factor WhiG [Thermosporothrix hazakensis]